MKKTGASLVRHALEQLGVKFTFGIPGVHNTEIYDELAAQRAINLIHVLEHVKGSKWARKPFLLEPWQKFIVCNLFGFKWRDGRNRFHECYAEIPRKNGI